LNWDCEFTLSQHPAKRLFNFMAALYKAD